MPSASYHTKIVNKSGSICYLYRILFKIRLLLTDKGGEHFKSLPEILYIRIDVYSLYLRETIFQIQSIDHAVIENDQEFRVAFGSIGFYGIVQFPEEKA